jgi:hypothetical protein
MVEPSVILEMLDEFRFDEAEPLIEETGDGSLRAELVRRRAEGERRGRELANRIIDLGNTQQIEDVLPLAHEPSTRLLLALAPDTSRKRAELYLRQAERWEDKRREVNERRLAEARRALDGLDLELATGLMRRIDGRFLSDEEEQERDRLLLDISARAIEVESLAEKGRQLIGEPGPPRTSQRRQSWWRRWFG